MTFTLHTDPENPERRWVTVARWEHSTLLAPDFIDEEANGASIKLEGTVRVVVANGAAVYRVAGWDEAERAIRLELIEATEILDA